MRPGDPGHPVERGRPLEWWAGRRPEPVIIVVKASVILSEAKEATTLGHGLLPASLGTMGYRPEAPALDVANTLYIQGTLS